MYQYTTLENVSYSLLYNIFLESFQGFRIVLEVDLESFCNMLTNSAYDPKISIGAFNTETNECMGYVLNSMKNINSKRKAYAILTATRPMFRRRGIMKTTLEHAKKLLIEENVNEYFTEVLEDNIPALALYEAVGFKIIKKVETLITIPLGKRNVMQYKIAVILSS